MSHHQETVINNELFQIYIQYQLCRLKNDTSVTYSPAQKEALIDILENCKFVNGDHLHAILLKAFENSVQKPLFDKVDTNSHTANAGMNDACSVPCFHCLAHTQK